MNNKMVALALAAVGAFMLLRPKRAQAQGSPVQLSPVTVYGMTPKAECAQKGGEWMPGISADQPGWCFEPNKLTAPVLRRETAPASIWTGTRLAPVTEVSQARRTYLV